MANFHFERFKRLPKNQADVWEAAIFSLPMWMPGEPDPFQPKVGLVASRLTGAISHTDPMDPTEDAYPKLMDAIYRLGTDKTLCGHRPGKVLIQETALAEALEGPLFGAGVSCEVVDKLDGMDDVFGDLYQEMSGSMDFPMALDADGVTVEAMSRFALAAKRFYDASLWDELCDEDLIQIVKPKPPSGMRFVSVMGAGGETYGLAFFNSLKNFDLMTDSMLGGENPSSFLGTAGVWSLSFDEKFDLPPLEANLWETQGFAVAEKQAYPLLTWFGPGQEIRRPDGKRLAFVTGLLEALTDSTGADFDAGAWTRQVSGGRGTRTYSFSSDTVEENLVSAADQQAMEREMKELEDIFAFEGDEDEPEILMTDALMEAEELVYDAYEARGRRQIQLAKEALEISADCVDAYVLLAEHERKLPKATALYAKGVEAGRRVLGEKMFKERAGGFWSILETRPFMQALSGMANGLWEESEREEALKHYRELLRLNPNDNQGMRYIFAGALMELNQLDELEALLDSYKDDIAASWGYIRALMVYKREGNSKAARAKAKAAIKSNRHMSDYLLGRKDVPADPPPFFEPGKESEAMCCISEIASGWQQTQGALDWLSDLQKKKTR